jgi:hypothetical protein
MVRGELSNLTMRKFQTLVKISDCEPTQILWAGLTPTLYPSPQGGGGWKHRIFSFEFVLDVEFKE